MQCKGLVRWLSITGSHEHRDKKRTRLPRWLTAFSTGRGNIQLVKQRWNGAGSSSFGGSEARLTCALRNRNEDGPAERGEPRTADGGTCARGAGRTILLLTEDCLERGKEQRGALGWRLRQGSALRRVWCEDAGGEQVHVLIERGRGVILVRIRSGSRPRHSEQSTPVCSDALHRNEAQAGRPRKSCSGRNALHQRSWRGRSDAAAGAVQTCTLSGQHQLRYRRWAPQTRGGARAGGG